jgi:predicted amidophosphoribosyltransferase
MLLLQKTTTNIFLIDDVITTGATLERVRVLYYKSGAKLVLLYGDGAFVKYCFNFKQK